MRVVVDGLEARAVGGLAADEPLGATVVYLSLGMAVPDRLLESTASSRRCGRRPSACSVQRKRSISTDEAYVPDETLALAEK